MSNQLITHIKNPDVSDVTLCDIGYIYNGLRKVSNKILKYKKNYSFT